VWWKGWLTQRHAVELAPRLLEVSAPAKADVTIASASVEVFRAFTPRELTLVQCVYGGGGPSPGTLLRVDLARPSTLPTIVADNGAMTPLSMPNAVINVGAGQTEYVAVSPNGRAYLYEWAITLHLVVDQRDEAVVLGSRSRPLRSWLGKEPAVAYDYDFQARRWRAVALAGGLAAGTH